MEENSTRIDNLEETEPEKENQNALTPTTANPAEAETRNTVAADMGKFKSVEALYKAYLSLEAEFTRRSQKLKELEENKAAAAPSPVLPEGEELKKLALGSDEIKDAAVREYLSSLLTAKSVPLVTGGVACAAPRSMPASIKAAGALAMQFLKKQ